MSMSGYGYSLPATAICPGCGTMVTLPSEPLYPDTPPAICATCETEVPDYRRESYTPDASLPGQRHAPPPVTPTPRISLENRRLSRGSLFRSLGGLIAERGVDALDDAKGRFNTPRD
jgi:hypothetical protein